MIRRLVRKSNLKEKFFDDGDFSYEDTPKGITDAFNRDFQAGGMEFELLDSHYDSASGKTKVKWEVPIYTEDLYDTLDEMSIPDTYDEEYQFECAVYNIIDITFNNYKVNIDEVKYSGRLEDEDPDFEKCLFVVEGSYKQDLS